MTNLREIIKERLLKMGLISNNEKAHSHALDLITEDVEKYITDRDREVVEKIEKKCGKKGSHHGSLGFQGILMDIHSYQTPEDIMRDDILALYEDK